MSIRRHNKNHLQKHADNCAGTLDLGAPPAPDDPMQFWVQHPTHNTLVDLAIFADGLAKEIVHDCNWTSAFSGRPQLIRQLAPAIKASLLGLSPATVKNYLSAFRKWWRLFDRVEKSAELIGQRFFRVEDVRQLTRIHYEYACQNKIYSSTFNIFVGIANATLKELGAPILYWESPANPKVERHLPLEVDTDELRVAMKQEWEAVKKHWALVDRVRDAKFIPQTEEESDLLKHSRYFSEMQRVHKVALPTPEQLRGGDNSTHFKQSTGLIVSTLPETVYPTLWDADAAFHMCLANTGWNPSVLVTLDAMSEELFLHNHPRDSNRYILIGTKARAGGKEQFVSGLWKTPWGPGPIIRTYLARVASLRELLQDSLLIEQERYINISQQGAPYEELARQHIAVQRLEQGCRSIWLFVDKAGEVRWISDHMERHWLVDYQLSYPNYLISKINKKRVARGVPPIASVKSSDFRDIFAMYVWRQSGSNILAVMRLLNHAQLRTTQRYVENNILNGERDQKIRTFLDDLFSELGQGRLDITILAHRQRFGSVTQEMEERLSDYRALERSRLSFGCKKPHSPPSAILPNADGSKRCGQHRCLLCKEGVMLPESLDGVAMRVEELRAIYRTVSVEAWLTSDFSQELTNGLNALKLFPVNDVFVASERWAQAIASGAHRVPGLRLPIIQREAV
jgi:hypothetical protein